MSANPWREVVEDILRERDGDLCYRCQGGMERGDTHIHHLEKRNEIESLVLLHPSCHMALHGELRRGVHPATGGRVPVRPGEIPAEWDMALERAQIARTLFESLRSEYQDSVAQARDLGMTLALIGDALGVSRQAVNQLLKRRRSRG